MSQLHVLVVDDNPSDVSHLQELLEGQGYLARHAGGRREALELVERHNIPIVLAAWGSSEVDAAGLCRALRPRTADGFLYLVALADDGADDALEDALGVGAHEILTKPVEGVQLQARLRAAERHLQREEKLRASLARTAHLEQHDALTELINRDHMYRKLEAGVRHAGRYRRPLSVVLCDLDDFTAINRYHGRATGDAVLTAIAGRLAGQIRAGSDWIARHSDDAFAVVLPEIDLIGGLAAAERLRQVVAATPVDTPVGPLGVTVSIGVAAMPPPPEVDAVTVEQLLDLADRCLGQARDDGGNRCVGRELLIPIS